jgi:gamma-glutamylcysteine synthetase
MEPNTEQHLEREKSLLNRQDALNDKLRDILEETLEIEKVGIETLDNLKNQGKKLRSTLDKLDQVDVNLTNQGKTLKRMEHPWLSFFTDFFKGNN